MRRFILHVGQSKTGTTAIQSFLSENRSHLRKSGFLYPDIFKFGMPLYALNHTQVAWSLIGKKSSIGVSFEEFLGGIEEELNKEPSLHTVILSSEAFLGEPHIWDCNSKAEWYKARLAKIKTLIDLLNRYQITVVVYLRRQDYWVNSAYNHFVKVERLVGSQHFSDIYQFIDVMAPRLDYAEEIRTWRSFVGPESMIVRPFERAQLHNGDVVSDFLYRIGFDEADHNFIHTTNFDTRNKGLPRSLFEVKRILNQEPKSKAQERTLIWALQKLAEDMPTSGTEWDFLLTASERSALLQHYYKSNSWLASNYPIAGESCFFHDPLAKRIPSSTDYPGLSTEQALEIMARLNKLMHTLGASRLKLKNRIGGIMRARFLPAYIFLRVCLRKLV